MDKRWGDGKGRAGGASATSRMGGRDEVLVNCSGQRCLDLGQRDGKLEQLGVKISERGGRGEAKGGG